MKFATTDPKVIASDARKVMSQHAEFENAEHEEARAYLELLTEVLAAAEPALPAISSAVPDHDLRGLLLVRGEGEDLWWAEDGQLTRVTRKGHGPLSAAYLVDNYGRHG